MLDYYGHACQLQRPGCTLQATTVHHLEPTSQRPDLFWTFENLTAACKRCNYSDGARIASENTRRTLERLYTLVEQQDQQIQQLIERLNQQDEAQPVKPRPQPSIR